MRVTRQRAQRLTLVARREFVASSGSLSFTGADRKQIYGLVERTVQAHEYLRLGKKNKGVARRYRARRGDVSWGAHTTSTARPPSDDWPPSRPRTSTTCGAHQRIDNTTSLTPGRAPAR